MAGHPCILTAIPSCLLDRGRRAPGQQRQTFGFVLIYEERRVAASLPVQWHSEQAKVCAHSPWLDISSPASLSNQAACECFNPANGRKKRLQKAPFVQIGVRRLRRRVCFRQSTSSSPRGIYAHQGTVPCTVRWGFTASALPTPTAMPQHGNVALSNIGVSHLGPRHSWARAWPPARRSAWLALYLQPALRFVAWLQLPLLYVNTCAL